MSSGDGVGYASGCFVPGSICCEVAGDGDVCGVVEVVFAEGSSDSSMLPTTVPAANSSPAIIKLLLFMINKF